MGKRKKVQETKTDAKLPDQKSKTQELGKAGEEKTAVGVDEAGEPDNQTLSEVEKLRMECAAFEEKYQRLYADFENFRRRSAKERLNLIDSASAEILSALLPIADDFERAVANNETVTDVKAIREGMELVHQKFKRLLESKGVKEIEVIHKDFDVDCQEVVTKIPAKKKKYRGKVVDVIEKGYYLNDSILRYAKVVIGE